MGTRIRVNEIIFRCLETEIFQQAFIISKVIILLSHSVTSLHTEVIILANGIAPTYIYIYTLRCVLLFVIELLTVALSN